MNKLSRKVVVPVLVRRNPAHFIAIELSLPKLEFQVKQHIAAKLLLAFVVCGRTFWVMADLCCRLVWSCRGAAPPSHPRRGASRSRPRPGGSSGSSSSTST